MQFKLFEIVEEKEDINQVMKQLSSTCTSCRLSALHPDNRGIIWRGSVHAKIAVIGEAPGDKETERGAPLVGPSGQEWERWAALMKINTAKDCFISNVIQCFPGDSEVYSSDIEKMYKRYYQGDLITVETVGGKLSGTPNHPVLTQRGWVSLNQINNTDSLVNCSSSKSIIFTEPQVTHRPTKFVELFNSLSIFGTSSRIVDSSMNFHGDGKNSQVEVVTFNRLLRKRINTSFFKKVFNLKFKTTDCRFSKLSYIGSCLSTFAKRILTFRDSPTKRISLTGYFLSLFQRCIGHSDFLSLTVRSKLNSLVKKAFLQCRGTDSNTLGKGVQSFPSDVSLDRVVNVYSKPFVGHVYNLQTSSNYYSINGYVVHNCQPEKIQIDGKWSQDSPDTKEIQACFPSRALRILKAMPNLEVVITLGWVAASALLGEQASTKTHEAQWFRSDLLPGVPIFCLLHPSFILRDPSIEKTKALEYNLELFRREYIDPATSKILTICKENQERT